MRGRDTILNFKTAWKFSSKRKKEKGRGEPNFWSEITVVPRLLVKFCQTVEEDSGKREGGKEEAEERPPLDDSINTTPEEKRPTWGGQKSSPEAAHDITRNSCSQSLLSNWKGSEDWEGEKNGKRGNGRGLKNHWIGRGEGRKTHEMTNDGRQKHHLECLGK